MQDLGFRLMETEMELPFRVQGIGMMEEKLMDA